MNNRIEEMQALIAADYWTLDEKEVGRIFDALRDALPVIEAALAANPVTSIAVALGDTLTPWKEKEEDGRP